MSRTIFSGQMPREVSQNMLEEGRRGQEEAVPTTASTVPQSYKGSQLSFCR